MEFLKAAFLGLVEGVTEFLPVSSTGHLILAGEWVEFTGERAKTFEIFIQLGAILAVVWLYRRKIFLWNGNDCKIGTAALTGNRLNISNLRLGLNVFVAFLPAAIAGFFLHDFVKNVLFRPSVVAASLVIGGILIFVIEGLMKKPLGGGATDRGGDISQFPALKNISWKKSLAIGIAQILALIPGVSRSAATIFGGMVFGLSRTSATEFSFFLAIPTIFAATVYDLWKSVGGLPGDGTLPGEVLSSSAMLGEISPILSTADVPIFAVGFVVSFFSALIVIKFFLRFVSTHTFRPFAWYRIVMGVVVILAVRNGF